LYGINFRYSHNNNIQNNNIWNCSSDGTYSCIKVYESDYNIFDSNKIDKSSSYGVWISSVGSDATENTDHNVFKNTNMINIEGTSVFFDDSGGSENLNNTFLNFTYNNESVDTNSQLIRKWYYRAYVNDTNGNNVSGAEVKAYNTTTNDLIESLTTGSDGWTATGSLIDYVNSSGTTYYYSNYTINASKSNYITGSNEHNITVSHNIMNDVFTLSSTGDVTSPQINFVSPTPPDDTTTPNTSIEINVSIAEENLDEVKFNWNGTNYTIFNDSVVLFMNFDNRSALGENETYVLDVSGNGNNGTAVGNANPTSSGKYQGAFEFDGDGDQINIGDLSVTKNLPFTVCAWFKANNYDDHDGLINKYESGSWNGFNLFFDESPKLCSWYPRDGSNYVAIALEEGVGTVSCPSVSTGKWYHAAVVVNTTGMYMYINGSKVQEAGWTGSAGGTTETTIMNFGNYTSNYFNGTIDEVMIFNRSLSPSEIQQLYFTNLYKYDTDKWILYVNQSKNSTDGLDDGTYTYFASAKDDNSNENSTETRTITISTGDTTPPAIEFVPPTPDDGDTQAEDYILVNVSANDSASNMSTFIDFDNSLVGWWRMDDVNQTGEGAEVYDYLQINNGTAQGNAVQTDSGYLGKGFEFDGDNDYLDCGSDSSLNLVSNLTISTWIKLRTFGQGGWGRIVDKGNDTAPENVGFSFLIDDSNDRIEYAVYGETVVYSNSNVISLNEWQHVAVVYNETNVIFYVNGSAQGTVSYTISPSDSSGYPLVIGIRYYDKNRDFNGTIDDVMLFNRSLSAEEILALYANQSSRYLEANFTSLSEGNHTFKAYAQDTRGNVNSTEERSVTVTSISQCTTLDQPNTYYVQTANIVPPGPGVCINITGENITFDGNGKWISNTSLNASGVYSNQYKTTIKNCNITVGPWVTTRGILLYYANNSYIYNNTFNNQFYGLFLYKTHNTTIENNTANYNSYTDGAYYAYGIILYSASNNTLINNTANSNNLGILVSESSNNTLINNTANSNRGTYGYGIDLQSGSNNNYVANNRCNNNTYGIAMIVGSKSNQITDNIANANDIGIAISDSSYNNVTNNIITNTTLGSFGYGMRLMNSSETRIISNTINSSDRSGIQISDGGNNTFINNSIWNCSYTGTYACIYVTESDSNVFDSNRINKTNAGGYSIWVHSSGSGTHSSHNMFKDTNLTNTPGDHIFLDDGSSSENLNNTFLNFSYESATVDSNSQLIRKWYYQAYANDTNGDNVSGAEVKAYNSSSVLIESLTTGSDGWTGTGSLIDYIRVGITKTYYSNYTINASKADYENASNIHNITISQNIMDDVFTLSSTGDVTFPQINFTNPTPPNGTTTTNKSIEINVSIVEENLDEVKFNWNGTNYTIFNDSAVLLMNFDNRSELDEQTSGPNNKTVDISAYGNNGTIMNDTNWTPNGRYHGAFEFDGDEDYISVTDNPNFDINNITVAIWMKRVGVPASHLTAISKWQASGNNREWAMTLIKTGSNWYPRIAYSTDGSNEYNLGDSNLYLAADVWYHYAFTYEYISDANSIMKVYINGTEIASTSSAAGPLSLKSADIQIGAQHSTNFEWEGLLDEVMIFNSSLSADEIQQLYFTNLYKFNQTQWYLYVNQSKNSTDGLDEGTYTYFASAKDDASNENSTETRTITISTGDTTPPAIEFVPPTPDDGNITPNDYIFVNVSANDSSSNISTFIDFDNSLVGWWRFDDVNQTGEGALVYDNSSYGNYGTAINQSVQTDAGYLGKGFVFEGDDDYIDCGNDSSLNLMGPLTISMWIYPRTFGEGGKSHIISKGNDSDGAKSGFTFGIRSSWIGNTNITTYGVYGGYLHRSDSNAVELNKWQHVAVVWNQSGEGNLTFYSNGKKHGIMNYTEPCDGYICSDPRDSSQYPLAIGIRLHKMDRAFNGTLDDVMIWNRALSDEEMAALYANTSSRYLGVNYTYLRGGTYPFKAYAQDIAGNVNSTEERSTTVTSISQCTTLDTPNTYYTQAANIEPDWDEDPCINISAENVTFDGNGFWIRNTSLAGTGIYSNQYNTTIKNCNVTMSTSFGGYGIELEWANNSYVYNNTLNSQNRGLSIHSTQNMRIENITANSNNVLGIAIILNSSNNTVTNITANSNLYGIYIDTYSNNNTLTDITANLNLAGIRITWSSNNTLSNITANSNSFGIYIEYSSSNNTLTKITANSNKLNGITLYQNANNNIIKSNTIWNCSSGGSYACITIDESDYNIFDGNTINQSSNYGIHIISSGSGSEDNSDHNIFRNSNMTNIDNISVVLYDSGGSENLNNTFLNFTYNNESVDTNSELIRKWYYKAYVNDTTGANIQNADVRAYNSSDVLIESLTTGSDGWTSTGELIEYVNNGGNPEYYSNYTINASKANYITGSNEHNITVSHNIMDDNFELTQSTSITACGVLDQPNTYYTQTANIEPDWDEDPCINITAENTTFDGNGKWISNTSLAGIGIYSNQYNTTIRNCNVTMKNTSGGYGIGLEGANNCYVFNNSFNAQYIGLLLWTTNTIIENNTVNSNANDGIHLQGGSNNTLKNNTANSNTEFGIHLESSSNNTIMNNIANSNNDDGIYLWYSSNNNLTNNIANYNDDDGINFFCIIGGTPEDNILINNTANSNSNCGINVEASSRNALKDNTANSNGYGICLGGTVDNNLTDNNIWNCTEDLWGSCLFVWEYSDNNIISGGIINLSAGDLISLWDSNNNKFSDISLYNANATANDVYAGGSANNTFLNVSYNISKEYVESDSQLIRKWYYKAYVNDTNGNDVENANVSLHNKANDLTDRITTNSTGWTITGEISDYVNNGGTRTYHPPYTITAVNESAVGFHRNYNVTDVTNNLNDVITIDIEYPDVSFVTPPTPADGSTQAANYIFVNVSANDSYSNISTFIDFDNSLVGWWRFSESSLMNGTNVTDFSVYGNNGTVYANDSNGNPRDISTTAGYFGSGAEFDGAGDYIDCGNDTSLNISNEITLSAWVRFQDYGDYPKIIRKSFEGDINPWEVYTLDLKSNLGYPRFIISNGSTFDEGGWQAAFNSSHVLSLNKWYHIAGTYNGSLLSLYIDGNLENTTIPPANFVIWTNNESLFIGNMPPYGDHCVNGTIDDVMVFNRGLSAEEIQALYANTSLRYLGHNFTNLTEGSHTFKAYTQDQAGNVNSTEERSTTVDATPPAIEFVPPTPDDGNVTDNDWIYVNVSANDSISNISTFIDFDDSLVLWMRMDDVNQTDPNSLVYDSSSYANNGTAMYGAYQVDGYMGKGFRFAEGGTQADNYIDVPDSASLDIEDEITLASWLKVYQHSSYDKIIVKRTGDDNCNPWELYAMDFVGGAPRIVLTDGTPDTADLSAYNSSATVPLNEWHHVVGTYNGTLMSIYLDGKLRNTTETDIKIGVNDMPVTIGGRNCTAGVCEGPGTCPGDEPSCPCYSLNSVIDDVMIFNRGLSAEEILGLYANTSTKYLGHNFTGLIEGNHTFKAYAQDQAGNVNSTEERGVTVDIPSPPTVTLNSPADNTHSSNTTQIFNCSATDTNLNTSLANITFYWDYSGSFIANGTSNITGESNSTNFTRTGLTDKSIIWNCYACDNASNCGFAAANYTITIDTIAPNISFTSPTPAASSTQPNTDIFVNVSASDSSSNISTFIDFDESLVGWWRLEDSINDETGKNNETSNTLKGDPVYESCALGKGLYLDASDDTLWINSTNYLSNTSGTISLWFNREAYHDTSTEASENYVFSHFCWPYWSCGGEVHCSGSASSRFYILFNDLNDSLYTYIQDNCSNGGGYKESLDYIGDFPLHEWYHIAVTYSNGTDMENGTYDVYVNGQHNYSGLYNKKMFTWWYTLNFGSWDGSHRDPENPSYGPAQEFNGSIDDILIFNRPLGAEEIAALYANTSAKYLGHNFTNLTEGTHAFKAYAQDMAGNVNETEERSVTVDATPPAIEFVPPTPDDGNVTDNDWIYVNVSVNDSSSNISTFIDFDNSLVGWWRMDDVNQTGEGALVYDNSDYENNGTAQGNAVQTDAGYLGKGFEFDGNGDVIKVPHSDIGNPAGNFTISVWAKISGKTKNFMHIVSKNENTNLGYMIEYKTTATEMLDAGLGNGSSWNYVYGSSWNLHEWHHVVLVYNGLHIELFDNGESQDSSYTGTPTYSDNPLTIGNSEEYDVDFNGTIDDAMIFNRSLSAEEVTALYANQSSRYLEVNFSSLANGNHTFKAYAQDMAGNVNSTGERNATVDTISPPIVTLNFPADDIYSSNTTQIFNCSAVDTNYNTQLANITFYWDYSGSFIANGTNNITGESNSTNSTRTGLTDRGIVWNCYACDNASNCAFASYNHTLLIDTINPSIEFVDPTPPNGNITANDWIFVNVSANDSNYISTFIDFDNTLVGWWRFDDVNQTTPGALVQDYMNRNNGTAYGNAAQTANGYVGKGFAFDGNNDYVRMGDKDTLVGMNHSYSFWVKVRDTSDGGIICKMCSPWDTGILLLKQYTDDLRIYIANTSSDLSDGDFFSDLDTWIHGVVVLNTTHVVIYKNGILAAGPAPITHSTSANDFNFDLGHQCGMRDLNGSLDDIIVFNRSLSAEEAAALYANTSSKYLSNKFTNLTDGNHTFKAYVQDLAGNVNKTEEREVTVETGTNVTVCRTLDQANTVYTQQANIEADADPCISIYAENITFDGNGFWIRNTSLAGTGIYSNQYNTTILNCNVTMSSSYPGFGIELAGANNSYILNNTLNEQTVGLYVYSAHNIRIENITANSNNWNGILLSSSSNNNITNITASSNDENGIYLESSSNNTLTDITANSNNNYGISLSSSSNNNITNITASSNDENGIYLESSSNNTLTNITASSNNNYGISLSSSSNNILSNNNMSNNTYNFYIGGTSNQHYDNNIDTTNTVDYSYKIYYNYSISDYTFDPTTTPDAGTIVCAVCDNVTYKDLNLSHYNWNGILFFNTTNSRIENITASSNDGGISLRSSSNNTLTGITANSNTEGIYLYQSSNNTLTNITANSNTEGIYLYQSSNNTLTNITANSNTVFGISLRYSSNNTLTNSSMWNCNSGGSYACIYVYISDYNVFVSNKINKSYYGVWIHSLVSTYHSNHNLFKNTNITNIDGTAVYLDDGSGSQNLNNTFLNCSYDDESVDTSSQLIRKWYYRAYVNDTSGANVPNADVKAYNSSNVLIESLTTGSDGWTSVGELIDYVNNGGNLEYYSNYTINASKTNYITGSKTHNITVEHNIMDDNFELEKPTGITVCGVLDQANTYYTQTANIEPDWDEDPCINITAENITFDGNGKWISNTSLAGTGIYSNQLNSTIQDCNVTMSSGSGGYGIELFYANNSYILNNTLNSQYHGLYLNEVGYTTIENNTANSNKYGIYLDESSSNTLTNNNMTNNTYNFRISGFSNQHFDNTIDTTNVVDYSSKIYYNYSISDYTFNPATAPDAGTVVCAVCDNVTYKDLNLSHHNYDGVYFFNTNNSKIDNVTANSNYDGIYLYLSSNNNLTGITANSNYNAIYLISSSNNNLIGITANSNYRGIFVYGGLNNTLLDITANSNTGVGIVLSGESAGGDRNTVANITANNNDYGMYLYKAEENTITNSTMNSNRRYWIYFETSSNNTITNNNIWNCSSAGSYACIGVFGSDCNIFDENRINKSSAYGIRVDGDNNLFRDTNMTSIDGTSVDIFAGSANNTFLNFTYKNETVDTNSELIRKWYLDVNVTNVTVDPLQGANVTAANVSDDIQFSELAGSNGLITRQEVIQYINTSTTADYNPYTINTTLTGYLSNSSEVNITDNTQLNVVLIKSMAPVIVYVNVTPDNPLTANPLNCSVLAYDFEQTTLYANFTWYQNASGQFVHETDYDVNEIAFPNGTTAYTTTNVSADDENHTKHVEWICQVTVYDSDGLSDLENGSETINDTPPDKVTLTSPPDGYNTTDRTPMFSWENASDDDNDTLNYTIQIIGSGDCIDDRDVDLAGADICSGGFCNYTPTEDLKCFGDDNYYYNWSVRAYDGEGYGEWSDTRNITINTNVSIILYNDSADFGSISLGESNDTIDDSPPPFRLRNNGNCFVNVIINSTDLMWDTQPSQSIYFRYQVDNVSGEAGAFNWSGSATDDWYNVPDFNETMIDFLNYSDITDEAEIELYIEPPPGEGAGDKSSTMWFTAEFHSEGGT